MVTEKGIQLRPRVRPAHGLPRNREKRLLQIKQRVQEGYYDSEQVRQALASILAEAFLDSFSARRAGK